MQWYSLLEPANFFFLIKKVTKKIKAATAKAENLTARLKSKNSL